ncbi:MAG: hypothetical protein ACYCT1_18450 [Steroidobacteraceae bacterium]
MRLWLFDLTTRERRTMTGGIVKLIGFWGQGGPRHFMAESRSPAGLNDCCPPLKIWESPR